MNERRRDRRFAVDTSAVLKIGKKPQVASVVNVSFHGLSVTVEDPPPLRQLVQIQLELPSGKKFTVQAKVVHVEANRIGLEFFGRNSNPDWDEFMQSLMRSSLLPPEPQQPPQPRPPPRPPPAPPPSRRSPAGPPNLPQAAPPPSPSSPPNYPGKGQPNFPSQAPPTFQNQAASLPLPPNNSANTPSSPPQGGPPGQGARLRPSDPPYQGQERRCVPRINLQLELRLRTPRSIHTAFTRSVSMVGATVVMLDGEVGIAEQVIVNLIQPGTNFSFKRDGVVRRIQPAADGLHVGVEFSPLDPMREVLFADFMNTAYATLSSG